eukprot:CAMPEP_0170582250 /NCGR_PEP_ID=MMETSP0224-20130122/7481_1 /TAXON_ID=285029 /ORGANISM="Togula jolla, Strain CCCM 725" /LENGTH=98 /DNA_ID=CAMNT_0010905457 /DNA_START=129 /DNA_END=426 /DNA_ORIENTATION=+
MSSTTNVYYKVAQCRCARQPWPSTTADVKVGHAMANVMPLSPAAGLWGRVIPSLLIDVVVHDLLDEVNMRKHHPAAAVACQAEVIEHLLLALFALEHL